jgi:hypothetical protein
MILKYKYFIFVLALVLCLALFSYLLGSYNVNNFSLREGLTSEHELEQEVPDLIEDTELVITDTLPALPGKFLFNDMFDFDLNNQLVKLQQFFFG